MKKEGKKGGNEERRKVWREGGEGKKGHKVRISDDSNSQTSFSYDRSQHIRTAGLRS